MSKIKVLMLVPNLQVANGVASFVMNYLRNLNHDAVQMDIVSYRKGASPYYAEVKSFGGNVYFLPSIKNLPLHIKMCNQILNEGQYDIIHDNTLHISIPLMWCAKRRGTTVRILHSHNSKMGETKTKELRNKVFRPVLCSLATDYVACSHVAGKMLFKEEKFEILPNVIRTEIYKFNESKRREVREKMGVQDKLVVGTVGRLAEQKNPLFAMKVFEQLLKIESNAEYWWIGDGELGESVKQYINQAGLSQNIKMLGSRDDTADLYQGMDVFFLPSLFEGLPVTGIEAQAMGLPVVVSDSVTSEMVYTNLIDFVSLSEPLQAWANHLKGASTLTHNRENYSKQLKESMFSDEDCGEKLQLLYNRFLKKVE